MEGVVSLQTLLRAYAFVAAQQRILQRHLQLQAGSAYAEAILRAASPAASEAEWGRDKEARAAQRAA